MSTHLQLKKHKMDCVDTDVPAKKIKLEELPPITEPQKKDQDQQLLRFSLSDCEEAKLEQFQKEPLEDNIDFISLESTLSLLQSRIANIKHDIKELNLYKQSIRNCDDPKSITRMITTNTDYLKEISYKGCCVKCPEIDWKSDFGIDLDYLKGENSDLLHLGKINTDYEIIKRDELFGFNK